MTPPRISPALGEPLGGDPHTSVPAYPGAIEKWDPHQPRDPLGRWVHIGITWAQESFDTFEEAKAAHNGPESTGFEAQVRGMAPGAVIERTVGLWEGKWEPSFKVSLPHGLGHGDTRHALGEDVGRQYGQWGVISFEPDVGGPDHSAKLAGIEDPEAVKNALRNMGIPGAAFSMDGYYATVYFQDKPEDLDKLDKLRAYARRHKHLGLDEGRGHFRNTDLPGPDKVQAVEVPDNPRGLHVQRGNGAPTTPHTTQWYVVDRSGRNVNPVQVARDGSRHFRGRDRKRDAEDGLKRLLAPAEPAAIKSLTNSDSIRLRQLVEGHRPVSAYGKSDMDNLIAHGLVERVTVETQMPGQNVAVEVFRLTPAGVFAAAE